MKKVETFAELHNNGGFTRSIGCRIKSAIVYRGER